MARRQPSRVEWRTGKWRSQVGDCAKATSGFHRIWTASCLRVISFRRNTPIVARAGISRWLSATLPSRSVPLPDLSILFDLIRDEKTKGIGENDAFCRAAIGFTKIIHSLDQILIEAKLLKSRSL
jgi:hypothetical protein